MDYFDACVEGLVDFFVAKLHRMTGDQNLGIDLLNN